MPSSTFLEVIMQKPDLDVAGSALWDELAGGYELSPPELVLLAELCHTADELATLREESRTAEATVEGSQGQVKIHPLFAELRAHRQLYTKLLADLALPAEFDEKGLTPRQQSAKKAADTRWSMERQKWGTGGKAS